MTSNISQGTPCRVAVMLASYAINPDRNQMKLPLLWYSLVPYWLSMSICRCRSKLDIIEAVSMLICISSSVGWMQ
jgi:hypothetical protein